MIVKQLVDEVVVLVLDGPRVEVLDRDGELVAVQIQGAYRRASERALTGMKMLREGTGSLPPSRRSPVTKTRAPGL